MNSALLRLALVGCMICSVLLAAEPQPDLPAVGSKGVLAIQSVQAIASKVGRYEKFELSLQVSATFENPFDPEQIEVNAEFVGPNGTRVEVPGFLYQPYRVIGEAKEDAPPLLETDGPPSWKVRFTPTEIGKYSAKVTVRDHSGRVESKPLEFDCIGTDKHGFVRVDARQPRYFAFDNGDRFIPIGHNLQNDWPTWRHSRLLADAGCNAARAWTFCHWTWLEWSFSPKVTWARKGHFMRSYGGAGVYNQRIAWIADSCTENWEKSGLHIMFCLGNSGELSNPKSYGDWGGHPYNAANGGPCAKASDFWTDERARKLYRNRLRYIVARYGYSPAVWAWELWNELGEENDASVAWQAEMSRYLRTLDPNKHLITTSHWGVHPEYNPRTWAIPEMDFTQSHIYHGVETTVSRVQRMLKLSPKPHIVGEGGGPAAANADPSGLEIHNTLWASALNGAAGPTLPWWWRERIEPKNLFYHYAAIKKFLESIPKERSLVPLPSGAVTVTAPATENKYSPVLLVPLGQTGKKAPRNRFVLQADGKLDHIEDFSGGLYGKGRASWANPPTLEVNYPVDGTLIVQINEASHAVVDIEIDGKLALREAAFDVQRKVFNKDLVVPVAAGKHEITLHNKGSDWAHMHHLLLTNYRNTSRNPDIDVFGLKSERSIALWFHHRLSGWDYIQAGVRAGALTGAAAQLDGMQNGSYTVEWWDARRGALTKKDAATAHDGRLELSLPVLHDDVACILRQN